MKQGLYIKTYGCQMNVYDSNRMADVLAPHGFELIETPGEASLIVLNTCHIREKAAEKLYSDIGRLRKHKLARAAEGRAPLIAVAGCVAQAEGHEIIRRAPDVDIVFGPQTYHRLPAMIEAALEQRQLLGRARVVDTDFPGETKFDHLPSNQSARGPTAFLTVQEGCDKFCTFCVVPYTRGAEFSRPVADIEEEARRLVDAGVVEITLLGQNVNAYHGQNAQGETVSLAGLIHRLARIKSISRIRYTTSHPRDMRDDLIAVHRDVQACMPYIHLPVQSGSDRVLGLMNRGHSAAEYIDLIDRLRKARPDIALSGDFIVGFPGETDADFRDTLALVKRANYAQAYSFKYSSRPGTPAAESRDQIPEAVKAERLLRLQDLLRQQQMAFNQGMIGRQLPVLFERAGQKPGQVLGKSAYMQSVHVEAVADQLMGRIVDVRIAAAGPNSLTGLLADRFAA